MKQDLIQFFSGVILANKIKDWANVISLDEYYDIGTHWIALHALNVISFDRFAEEHISKKMKKSIGNRNIITHMFRTRAYDSVMSEYFCIEFFDFMFKDKSLTELLIFFHQIIKKKL